MNRLLRICGVFGAASLMSFGGGNAIVPELELQTVHQYGWLSEQQFADIFAIAQVAPGPSTLLVTLLGFRAAGLAGAAAATVAMVLPAGVLVFIIARFWLNTGKARWHAALEHGLAPVGVGLVAASGIVIAHSIDTSLIGWCITGAATAILMLTRVNPLPVVLAGGTVALVVGGV